MIANTNATPAMRLPIPTAALAIDGVAPAEGDTTTLSVEVRIGPAEGPDSIVEVLSINGQPVAAPVDEDAAMMEAAKQADAESGMNY